MYTLIRVLTLCLLMFTFVGLSSAQETAPIVLEAGTVIQLQGQVTDSQGTPLAGLAVEIWSTDANGNYNHPNDSDPSQLVDTFQYFGTATTDENGYYAFTTIKPAQYEPRPTHIHFKVKEAGAELLTSQFYFPEEFETVSGDGVFSEEGNETLFVQVSELPAPDGQTLYIATGNIVLDLNGTEADVLPVTAAQTEGPYYPVVDFSGYDNNLTSVAEGDTPVLPLLATTAPIVEFTLINLNTASPDELLTIPNMGNRMVREFEEYRPYVSISQFRREIGKYVSQEEVAAYEAFVYVPIQINDSDAETLMQIPNVDASIAEALMAARPFASNEAFLAALASYLPEADVAYAANFLD